MKWAVASIETAFFILKFKNTAPWHRNKTTFLYDQTIGLKSFAAIQFAKVKICFQYKKRPKIRALFAVKTAAYGHCQALCPIFL